MRFHRFLIAIWKPGSRARVSPVNFFLCIGARIAHYMRPFDLSRTPEALRASDKPNARPFKLGWPRFAKAGPSPTDPRCRQRGAGRGATSGEVAFEREKSPKARYSARRRRGSSSNRNRCGGVELPTNVLAKEAGATSKLFRTPSDGQRLSLCAGDGAFYLIYSDIDDRLPTNDRP